MTALRLRLSTLSLLYSITVFVTSCSATPVGDGYSMVVSWSEYDGTPQGAESIEFFVNGKSRGKGSLGFESVLNAIDRLPSSAVVLFDNRPYDGLGGGWGAEFPHAELGFDEALLETAARKRLTIRLAHRIDLLGTIYLYRPSGSYFDD